MSTKRKRGTPRRALDVDVHPDNWHWLEQFSKEHRETMGLALDRILSAMRRVHQRQPESSAR